MFYCKMVPCKYNKSGNKDNALYFGREAALRRHLKDVHRIKDWDRWIEKEDAPPKETNSHLKTLQYPEKGSDGSVLGGKSLPHLILAS
jgi:hypothetical protein